MRVGYLGPPGTFGEMAARSFAPEATHLPFPSHAAVAAAVDRGEADCGVLAIENSLSGSVAETLDILIHDTTLQIQQELVVPVVHNLVVKPGVTAAEIEVIYSHTQVLGQCRRFLETRFPQARFEAALSTAEAAEQAVRRGAPAAAIATVRAAELYGGEIIERGVQDSNNNVTRFVVIGREATSPTGHDRTSIAFTLEERPGSLAEVLREFAARSLNCSKIESRPTREVFGEYVFLIDFHGHRDDPVVREVLAAIAPCCGVLKVFGSYPRWR